MISSNRSLADLVAWLRRNGRSAKLRYPFVRAAQLIVGGEEHPDVTRSRSGLVSVLSCDDGTDIVVTHQGRESRVEAFTRGDTEPFYESPVYPIVAATGFNDPSPRRVSLEELERFLGGER